MFVAASTDCYASMPFARAVEKLADLEFQSLEVAIHEDGNHLRPSEVAADTVKAINQCKETQRLNVAAYSVRIHATGEEHYRQFLACCRLAKATKVVSITVPSAELGTPFNEEVEHLRRLVAMAGREGVLVSIKSQVGRLSQDPDTVVVLCDNVKGLGVTLDPSHYICGPHAGKSYDQLMKYVYHVQLRDTKRDQFQVLVGQGEIEYSRLITQLRRVHYNRGLSVNIAEMPGIEQEGELRKLQRLLESLL